MAKEEALRASAENLRETVSVLTERIGIRLAGSEGEKKAAEYLRGEMAKYAPKAYIEYFPNKELFVEKEELHIEMDGVWQRFGGTLFSSAASTDGKPVEAELVYFDAATGYMRQDLSFLTGKAVVHLGCHITCEDNYRRLMEAKPAFILFVDTRYPADIPLADGLFPAYVSKYGSVPSMDVAFQDAWKWKSTGAKRARLCVQGGMRPSQTSVVIAEIPGTDPGAGIIYAGGHHDTQAATVGADDNAIGSAAVLELSRLLSAKPHRRTYRLISFGAEEQLSVGSSSYVRAHRQEIEQNGVFMCNFDSFGSVLGWSEFVINAQPALCDVMRGYFQKEDIYYKEQYEPSPYTDQFPFAACGVPGVWVNRQNCTAGKFYHHRPDNKIDKLDFGVSTQFVNAAFGLLEFLGDADDITPYVGIPAEQRPQISALFDNVYGGF